MYFIRTYIFLLGCVFFLPCSKSNVLSIQMWSFDGGLLKYYANPDNNNSKYQQFVYHYTYSKTIDEHLVHFACKTQYVMNPTLQWKINTREQALTTCLKKNVTELNYITNLDASQNGNNLTCLLTVDGRPKAQAQVIFQCLNCKETKTHTLNAKCPTETEFITTYINGEFTNKIDKTVEFANDQPVTVHCAIEPDEVNIVELQEDNFLHGLGSGVIINRISNSVYTYKLHMTDEMDDRTIICKKRNIIKKKTVKESRIRFKIKSNLFIEIKQSDPHPRLTYLKSTNLTFNDNDDIELICIYKGTTQFAQPIWFKNGAKVNGEGSKKNKYSATLTKKDSGTKLTCKLDEMYDEDGKSIILKFNYPKRITSTTSTDSSSTVGSTDAPSSSELDTEIPLEWIAIGVASLVLIVTVIIVVISCKRKRPIMATSTSINNVLLTSIENNYTTTETPQVDPTYSAPVDDANLYAYSYTTNQNIMQDTYSTPFVPTIEEMYTKPTPKNLRTEEDPGYQRPGKYSYVNVGTARKNQTDPGYSSVAGTRQDFDSTSETYTYCNPAGYSRPN